MEKIDIFGAFGSRLGRKVVSLLLISCLLPMFVFAITLYFQSTWLLRSQALDDMKNYVDMASEQVFTALKNGEFLLADLNSTKIEAIAERLDTRDYFNRLYRLDAAGRPAGEAPDVSLSEQKLRWLRQGKPALTSPYKRDGHFTVSVVQPGTDGGFVAGELKLERLWRGLRPSNFGSDDIAVVTDKNLKVLASSEGPREFPFDQMPRQIGRRIPGGRGMVSGRADLEKLGEEFSWSVKRLWLNGRYRSGPWYVFLLRPERRIDLFSRQVLRTLIIFFLITVLVFVVLAERFSRHILSPVIDLHRAANAVEDDEVPPAIPLDRDDELGELARVFERVRHRMQKDKSEED